MPLYEYHCSACGHRFERIVKFSDAPLTTCPHCGKEALDQLISAPAVQFKGSGWYVTDYARKSSPASSSSASAKPETTAASKDGGSAASSTSSTPASPEKSTTTPPPAAGNSSSGGGASKGSK